MTRPKRDTVEYVYLDTKDGQTIETIEHLYGNDGFTLWIKTLRALGATDGHYLDLSVRARMISFAAASRVTMEKAEEMFGLFAELEAIDRELWQGRRIVWSQNLVNRLAPVYSNRGREAPQKPPLGITSHSSSTTIGNNTITIPSNPCSVVKCSEVKCSEVKGSEEKDQKKDLKRGRKVAPAPPQSEACMAYREIFHLNPNRIQSPEIDRVVQLESLNEWVAVCRAWALFGYSPRNVKGMLDWFVKGIPEWKKGSEEPKGFAAVKGYLEKLRSK